MDARSRWTAWGATALLVGVMACWAGGSNADVFDSTPDAPAAGKPRGDKTRFSMSSCMAASCHGGLVQQEGEAWRSSYTAWFTRDPHAKAYNDLFTTRSRRMIARLEQGSQHGSGREATAATNSHDYLAALARQGCLACHASQAASPQDMLAASSLGCHDCHGEDQGWGTQHYLASWKQQSAARRRQAGMTDTKDLSVRATVCVGCHIGAPASADSPLRDMNHDLIAAGHPRLNFEFAAYQANLPPHWDETKDRARLAKIHDNVEAESWLTGQEVSAAAALDLLMDRAERAADPSSHSAVWPEFSEYDCYGCHHQLASPTTRERNSGRWQWGTWHFAIVQPINPEFAELTRALQRPGPDPAAVAALRFDLRTGRSRQQSAGSLAELIERLANVDTAGWHWDQYTQWYLGLRALQAASRHDDRGQHRDVAERREQLDKVLQRLETKLKFSDHTDSPWNFDALDPELEEIVDQVGQILPALVPRAAND